MSKLEAIITQANALMNQALEDGWKPTRESVARWEQFAYTINATGMVPQGQMDRLANIGQKLIKAGALS